MDQALAAVRHQVGLGVAPGAQRVRPLRRALQVEQLHALEDHRAVHDARGDRPDLARGHRHHDLVEPRGATGRVAQGDQCLAVPQGPERAQVGVTEPATDVRCRDREVTRRGGIA